MIPIGYFARLKGDTMGLIKFQWLADDKLQIWVNGKWEDANPNEYEIIEVGQITSDD